MAKAVTTQDAKSKNSPKIDEAQKSSSSVDNNKSTKVIESVSETNPTSNCIMEKFLKFYPYGYIGYCISIISVIIYILVIDISEGALIFSFPIIIYTISIGATALSIIFNRCFAWMFSFVASLIIIISTIVFVIYFYFESGYLIWYITRATNYSPSHSSLTLVMCLIGIFIFAVESLSLYVDFKRFLKTKNKKPCEYQLKKLTEIYKIADTEIKTSENKITIIKSNLEKKRNQLIEQEELLKNSLKNREPPKKIVTKRNDMHIINNEIKELNALLKDEQLILKEKKIIAKKAQSDIESIQKLIADEEMKARK